ncbi:MAG: hypothetical protein U1F15_04635 [Burkholderiales bacterium]
MTSRSLAAALFAAALAMPGCVQAAETSKACETARRKVEREQRSINAAADSIARDRTARESCTTRSQCARYDASIADAERSKSRHETRLARFKVEVGQTCAAP